MNIHYNKFIASILLFFSLTINSNAQDTSNVILQEVQILGNKPIMERLDSLEGVNLYAGKKNEVILISNINANTITNNARQIFARVPGVNIWENDGSGIQISIATRGLNPNRSWEFNTRQNGYDISSDVFGYPEAYYNPPIEAVEKIQLVRGAASLQFGPQFGGMINYVLKRPTTNKPFSFETQNAVGSYGMLSSYNAIGGNFKKWTYYAYNHSRKGNGWRDNGFYEVRNTHAYLQYKFSEKANLSAEYTNMDYLMQQPGGLTDAQFASNARQSVRNRNWFSTPWNLANINLEMKPSKNLSFNLKVFGLLGQRNSIGFVATPNIKDSINTTINAYNNRQVDTDQYKNIGSELRGLYSYNLLGQISSMAFGARIYSAQTIRKQRGKGDSGFDYNTTILTDKYPTEYQFTTRNFALFVENTFKLTNNLSVTPGIRFENIASSIAGRANVTAGNDVNVVPQTVKRSLFISGIGVQYKIKSTNIYANISQAYRPVLIADLTPPSTTDVIDPNLRDASGFNADLGYRGNVGSYIHFDIGAFYILYDNRIGTIRKFINDDPTNATYQYRTNLGKSANQGIEGYLEFNALKLVAPNTKLGNLNIFASLAFIKAEYIDFKTTTISGTPPNVLVKEDNLKGKQVEYAPKQIHNIGITYSNKNFSATAQTRITSEVYSDASNTEKATTAGTAGKIDGYTVYDISAEYKFLANYNIKAGINNLTDQRYATRRSGGYPGPGLLPAEGRSFYISVGAKF